MAERISRRWARGFLWGVAALGIVLTASLGRWQLDRAAQKSALASAMEAQRQRAPLSSEALPHEVDDAGGRTAWLHRLITVRGVWRPEATIYLDNRPMNERPGFFVLTPLVLDGQRDAVLVQRGWLPRQVQDRTSIAPYETPTGVVTVHARVASWPSRRVSLGDEAPGPIRLNVDPAALGQDTGLALRTVALVEEPGADQRPGQAGPDGLWRDWPRPASDLHKHYGYAVQWFGMSGLILGLTVWFQWVKPRINRRRFTP